MSPKDLSETLLGVARVEFPINWVHCISSSVKSLKSIRLIIIDHTCIINRFMWDSACIRKLTEGFALLLLHIHYIIKLFIVAKVKNCKVHYGASHTTMSGYDCQNKCVFSFRRNDNSDVAVVTSRGRVFQILGPAVANERSPTVTQRDGRTSRRLVDDDRRRVLAGMSAM